MIQIGRPHKPAALRSDKITRTLAALREKARRGDKITSSDIPSHWTDVRDDLYKMHSGKCCFCERKRDKAREPDVEHYRPKARVTENRNHPGYWWLAYDWDNLLWSCKACNEDKKGNHFPLRNENSRVDSEVGDLSDESPLLLNPVADDCEKVLIYEWSEYPASILWRCTPKTEDRRESRRSRY